MKTPILFLTYKRFYTAEVVFNAIRKAQPAKLYFASNAPNLVHGHEISKVAKVRSLIDRVDWPCEVKIRFLEEHLPVKQSVSSSLDWFFEHEEQGIILEDDCLPHPDFFPFSETLLNQYATNDRVWVITGNNFQNGIQRGYGSYYFSRYNHVWGWASWRRAWQHYDGDLSFWPNWKRTEAWISEFSDRVERRYWEKIFDRMYTQQIDTWDYPWSASVWYHGGLTATPNVNLVSNIGFGLDSTHTASADSPLAGMVTSAIGELTHPTAITRDQTADRYAFDHAFGGINQRFPWSLLRLPRRTGGFIYRKLKRGFC
jgi:hypothetical protein